MKKNSLSSGDIAPSMNLTTYIRPLETIQIEKHDFINIINGIINSKKSKLHLISTLIGFMIAALAFILSDSCSDWLGIMSNTWEAIFILLFIVCLVAIICIIIDRVINRKKYRIKTSEEIYNELKDGSIKTS